VGRKVADAFLALDATRPEDRTILELLSANGRYVRVDVAEYAPLREAAIREGLLK
jgi:ABC-type phosphate/phosphonate transport system substrate-binding protein